MVKEDVIRLALEAGLFDDDQEPLPEYLERFFEQAFILGMQEQARKSVDRAVNAMADAEVRRLIAKEREECAKVRAGKPRELPSVGTGALLGEQQFCFEKG